MLITLEPHGIFRYNVANLSILKMSNHCYANVDKSLSIISLAGLGLLVKMLIIIEQLGIFCILIHFSIIETQLCKTATRLCQEKMSF